MQSLLLMASATALLHSTMVSSTPVAPMVKAGGPMPQNGVWALLPDKCDQPTGLDLNAWPKCATPIGFMDDEVAALEKPGPGKKASAEEFYSIARTKYSIAAGATATSPAVAQIVVPMVFSRSYYFLAIAPKTLDESGQFAEARGWPVACLPRDQGGCTPKALADVQTQAAIEPSDPQRLYRLVRIVAPAVDAPAIPPAPLADDKLAPAPLPGPASGPVTETPLPPVKDAPASPATPPTPGLR
jgi:hypothetical protein